MMNVLQIQDDLKNFSEEQLVREMQQPSGNAPQFLVLSELNRRRRVKGEFAARQAQKAPTVAEEAVAAAGVPQSGMMGMSEAMAPASVDSGGIGSMMPRTMQSGGFLKTPNEIDEELDSITNPENMNFSNMNLEEMTEFLNKMNDLSSPVEMAEGGLIEGIADSVSQNAEALQSIQEATMQNSKILQDQRSTAIQQPQIPRPMPIQQPIPIQQIRPRLPGFGGKGGPTGPRAPMNRFGVPPQQRLGTMAGRLGTGGLGFGQYASRAFGIPEPQSMAEGGVIRAQSGRFFDAMGRPTQELINAMIMQESGGDVKARGSLDEVGLSQIRPSTAIMPGYGVKSMFPELESQVGKGKKYATAQEAYLDNKEMVDARLEEGDTSKDFMADLLTGYRKNTDTDAGAISAYNVGLGGLKNIKNPADFKYFTEVASKMNPVEYDETPMKSGIMSAEAATDDDKERADGRSGFDKLFDIIPTPDDSLSGFENMMETDPDKKFLFGEKGFDMLKKQYKDRIEKRNNPDIKRVDSRTGTQKLFNIIPEPEDSLSGFETVNMGSPAEATDKEKAETEAALTSAAKKETPDAPEAKTQLTTLEQELLNRQKQLQKDRDFDRYMALAQAGLSIMSSDKPTLAGAIGEGGTAGLTAFREAQERYQEGLTDILNARVKLASKKVGLTKKEAISAISNIDSTIAKLDENLTKTFDEDKKKQILGRIAQLNFQKRELMPTAGFDYLPVNVSDSAAAKS